MTLLRKLFPAQMLFLYGIFSFAGSFRITVSDKWRKPTITNGDCVQPFAAKALSGQSRENNTPTMSSWEVVGDNQLPSWLIFRARQLGFISPTVVQALTLSMLLRGSDAVIQAQTGSGKTLAYLMPLLATINIENGTTQGIVVLPTRELGDQVATITRKLAAGAVSQNILPEEKANTKCDLITGREYRNPKKIIVASIFEESDNRKQPKWIISHPPHIIIASPVALNHLLATGSIQADAVKFLVVDEIDACADMSSPNGISLHKVLGRYLSPSFDAAPGHACIQLDAKVIKAAGSCVTEKNRQSVFLSASVPQPKSFMRQCIQRRWLLRNHPTWINANAHEYGAQTPLQVEHRYLITTAKKKLGALHTILRRETAAGRLNQAVVFFNANRPLKEISITLDRYFSSYWARESSPSTGIDMEQNESNNQINIDAGVVRSISEDECPAVRNSIIGEFRNGNCRILLATDLASRGLDVPEISHVIMFDSPATAESYLHRAGRTGRMGRPGSVITIIRSKELFQIQRVGNFLSVNISHL